MGLSLRYSRSALVPPFFTPMIIVSGNLLSGESFPIEGFRKFSMDRAFESEDRNALESWNGNDIDNPSTRKSQRNRIRGDILATSEGSQSQQRDMSKMTGTGGKRGFRSVFFEKKRRKLYLSTGLRRNDTDTKLRGL